MDWQLILALTNFIIGLSSFIIGLSSLILGLIRELRHMKKQSI
jgi:hypothetical protein